MISPASTARILTALAVGVTLDPATAASGPVSPIGVAIPDLRVYVLDADTVQVGFPCFYTGLDLALGPLAVTLLCGSIT